MATFLVSPFLNISIAIKRDGNTSPATMYQVNHCVWDGTNDNINTDLSGIGGGLYATWGKVNFSDFCRILY